MNQDGVDHLLNEFEFIRAYQIDELNTLLMFVNNWKIFAPLKLVKDKLLMLVCSRILVSSWGCIRILVSRNVVTPKTDRDEIGVVESYKLYISATTFGPNFNYYSVKYLKSTMPS